MTTLKPGRELDLLIAKHVFGWDVDNLTIANLAVRGPVVVSGSREKWPKGCPLVNEELKPYSTDIGAAMEVFEHISKERIGPAEHPAKDGRSAIYKPVIQLEAYEHDDCYTVTIGRCKGVGYDDDVSVHTQGPVPYQPAETSVRRGLAYTICLAALKLMGVEV